MFRQCFVAGPAGRGLLFAACATGAVQLVGCAQPGQPVSVGGLTITATPAPPPGSDGPLVRLTTPNAPPRTTRSAASLAALFAKGNVSGSDLLTELRALRTAARADRTAAAMVQFIGGIDGGPTTKPANARTTSEQRIDWLKAIGKAGQDAAEGALRQAGNNIAFDALDAYLTQLADDPARLSRETIQLPDGRGLTPHQAQRVVTMAAVVIVARISNDVLSKAKNDFANIETGYIELLDRREKAATLLFEVLGKRNDPVLAKALSPADIEYLNAAVAGRSVREFANDLGAQNLALQVMRHRDPVSYAQYRAQADGWRTQTRAYVRTISGVAAFGGLLSTFAREATAAVRGREQGGLLEVLPFGVEFAKEAVPLVALSAQTMTQGVVLQPVKAMTARRFRLTRAETTEEVANAAAVFAALRQRKADAILADALFRDEAPGLLYRLYQCDRAETGRMLDAAVPAAARESFARDYLRAEAAPGFAFVNALAAPGADARERELGDQLLRRDHRKRTDDMTRALSAVQTGVVDGHTRWSDDQLLRLIFANREGAAARATLQLGEDLVRPVPSMQAVYVYESLVDGCRSLVDDRPPPAGRPTSNTGARPSSKPSNTRPAMPQAQRDNKGS